MAHAMVAWADRLLVDGAYRQTTSSLHDTAVEIARRMGDNEVVSGILQAVAISFWQHGDTPTAASWYERALGEARGASEDWLLYVLETMTAFLLETPSDHARGLACAEEFAACVSAFKQTAGTPKEAVAQLVLGHARLRAGDKQGALDAYEKARAVCHANGLANKLLAEVNQSIDGLPRV